tara:strand:+ start:823 stop:1230 length:408 start_codon:yes stop_codon:yes gene_type:complete
MKQPQIPIVRLLKTNSDITDTVGQNIFPLQAPPGSTLPMIIYAISDNQPQDSKDGSSTMDVYEMQITMLNRNYPDIVRLANAVRSQLDYVKEFTYGGITLQLVYFIDEIEAFDKDMDQSGTYIKTQTYGIRIKNI